MLRYALPSRHSRFGITRSVQEAPPPRPGPAQTPGDRLKPATGSHQQRLSVKRPAGGPLQGRAKRATSTSLEDAAIGSSTAASSVGCSGTLFHRDIPSRDYFASQALTLPGFALTHCSAAFSGSMCFPAMRLATRFWSSAVHFQRLITPTAGEPVFANFDVISLPMIVCP